jgi:hypothetical protein
LSGCIVALRRDAACFVSSAILQALKEQTNAGWQGHARPKFHQNHVAENMSPEAQLYTLIYV